MGPHPHPFPGPHGGASFQQQVWGQILLVSLFCREAEAHSEDAATLAWPRGPALRLTFYCDSLEGGFMGGEYLQECLCSSVGPALSLIFDSVQ